MYVDILIKIKKNPKYKGIKETCELQTEVGDERAKSARNTLRVMAQMMVAGELYSDLFVYPNCETP